MAINEKMNNNKKPLPELLAPAGSFCALEAALEGGADAVYLGGTRFNARINADNFDAESLRSAVTLAHAHRAKIYLTLNTLTYDRELPDLLGEARAAYVSGVDALIMADLGAAALVHKALPDLHLHASTQASGHSAASGIELAKLGFCRMVCAREMSVQDINSFTAHSPIEAEVFVHGALCVCHSGQCLFSSVVGGRSGNRGECAQPCRLPYRADGQTTYPLSLKDLCLAGHVPELIDAGVSSLKIEGRMKSPEYVLAVTRVWRRLLDERRAASPDEMEYLASIFSRGGFTDGYFTKKINSSMLGVRSEHDKQTSRALPPFTGLSQKAPLDMDASIVTGQPMKLTVSDSVRTATVTGDIPETALRVPSEREAVLRNLTKLGQTPYVARNVALTLDGGLAVPVSKLNALRREAVSELDCQHRALSDAENIPELRSESGKRSGRTARFVSPEQIPDSARNYFDIIYLPLAVYDGSTNGVILPAVIFDSERPGVIAALKQAYSLGARHALVGNIGHASAAREAGFILHGDFRLNATSCASVAVLESLGFEDVILSPELTLPQIRDIAGNVSVITYGRLPLMLLEKCVSRDSCGCNVCRSGHAALTDRRSVTFPVLREEPHRNIVYNSVPTYMADRADQLARNGVLSEHFIFSVESAREAAAVIDAYKSGDLPGYSVRRI